MRLALEAQDIEARPTWKPMYLQPVFAKAPSRIDGTNDRLFATGLCLPSPAATYGAWLAKQEIHTLTPNP